MTEQNLGESRTALTFEDVWTMFRETDRKFRETDRKFQETDREIKETGRVLKETSRIVGDLGNKLGIVVEHLVLANIKKKFNDLGYEFTKTGPNVLIDDKKKQ
ncbi:MAG: hypothetical protein LBQ38_08620, partial [Spirochaetaceae bacterium]|nr:hypothetical protein [Spirochaetaceae bacterium]